MAIHVTDAETTSSVWAMLERHPLFEESARYAPVFSPLAVEKCDRRLRQIRHMPSTADATPQQILDGMSRVYAWGRKWLEVGAGSPRAKVQGLDVMQRIERLRHMARAGVSEQMKERVLASLSDLLPVPLRGYVPSAGLIPSELLPKLDRLELLLLDDVLSRSPELRARYLKRVYRVVDQGLSFNSTTDQVRLKPVLAWIAHLLADARRRGGAYADIGCAVAGGAPGVQLAAEILRPTGGCQTIHGVDVVAPDRELARRWAREKQILLYASDPLRRPLPRRYDVILLANVHRHLTRPEQFQLLQHLFHSLEKDGMLFVNWRFNDRLSPCLCLQKTGNRPVLAAEANCV